MIAMDTRAGLALCFAVLTSTALALEEKARVDESSPRILPPNAGIDGGLGGHWGVRDDRDWVDDRPSRADTGPFLSSSLDTPAGLVLRAVSVRLGERRDSGIAFDTVDCTWKAAWSGGFLELDPARFGLIGRPRIAGDVRVHPGPGRAWSGVTPAYRGLRLHGEQVIFIYDLAKTRVLDLASTLPIDDGPGKAPIFVRTIECASFERESALRLAPIPAESRVRTIAIESRTAIVCEKDESATLVALEKRAPFPQPILEQTGDAIAIRFIPAAGGALARVFLWSGPRASANRALAALDEAPDLIRPSSLCEPGPSRWTSVVTKGRRAADDAPWVIDTATVPYDNPWHALLFLSGLDFFSDGRAAVSAAHGDVWIVGGLDDDLDRVEWHRFATGLFQPLGVRIVDDTVHVIGRDRITRLVDQDGNDEADLYESFTDAVPTSPGGHDFVTCLETDRDGNFYWVDPQGLHRVSNEGSDPVVLATGFRNPNGLSVSPTGVITVAPQEGEWTPASMVCEIEEGGYYGYGGPRITSERPLGFDPPLCYIPRHVDNSTGSQVWVTSSRWGPLQGQLLNLSFGRSSIGLLLRDTVEGQAQGAIVPFRLRFLSGAMRGRFSPSDGQLWVAGMNGWVTNAIADGSLQRVRFTGRSACVPFGIRSHTNGIFLEFTAPLDARFAVDPGSWNIEEWQYRYAADYGSKEWSVASPDKVGHDPVTVESVHLLEGKRSVFLEIPTLRPVMQLAVRASLEGEGGIDASFELYATLHRLRERVDVNALDSVARTDPDTDSRGSEPSTGAGAVGTILRLEPVDQGRGSPRELTGGFLARDSRHSRTLALHVRAESPPSPFLPPGPFRARFRGRLVVPNRDHLRFSAHGRGRVRFVIDGKVAFDGEGDDLSTVESEAIFCERGGRPFELWYETPDSGDATIAITWEGRSFSPEPIPPTALRFDPSDPELTRGEALRRGRVAIAARRCLRCHVPHGNRDRAPESFPELRDDAPSLSGIGARRRAEWIARVILDPRRVRSGARMPRLGGDLPPGERARAAYDIASYLARETETPEGGLPHVDDATVRRGGELFATLGCFTCHPIPGTEDDSSRSAASSVAVPSLRDAASSLHFFALREFIFDPSRHHPATRMPVFPLREGEASALAAFIIERSRSAEAERKGGEETVAVAGDDPFSQADPDRGRELIETLGCLRCHPSPDRRLGDRSRAPSFEAMVTVLGHAETSAGCLASEPPAGAPRFDFAPEEREEIAAFLATAPEALFRSSEVEIAERAIQTYRCGACHDRDGVPSEWSRREHEVRELLRPDSDPITVSTRPDLTLTGDKLHADWHEKLLRGTLGYTVRPWLGARMPRFPQRASVIARGLAHAHGRSGAREPRVPSSQSLETAGRRLLGDTGGLSCVTCHSVGDRPARMRLHFGVVNLEHARERLLEDWYLRWMLDPQRIDPATPMPAYADEDGRSALVEILAGDARQQFLAIWAALGAGKIEAENGTGN